METVTIKNDGGVRIIEMDRPKALNAFSAQLMDDLTDAFLEANKDPSVRVAILTGAGRAFSAGADLTEMGQPPKKPKHGFPGLLDAIFDFEKPFIVAVNGVGAGVGATICGLADLTYMADEARLRCPFSALGLTAEAASTVTFPRLMGRQNAMWFLLASEWWSAQQCAEAGLVLKVLPKEELMPYTMAQAQKLAALPTASLIKTKKLIMDPLKDEMRAAAKAENQGLAELMGGPANKEALAAFIEKRDPDFSGL